MLVSQHQPSNGHEHRLNRHTAPILDTTSGLPVDTSEVTDLVNKVETTVGNVGLPSLPVRGLDLPDTSNLVSTDEVTSIVTEVESLVGGADIIKKSPSPAPLSLDLSSVLITVDGLLSDILGLVNTTQAAVDALVSDLENADVEGVLSTVEDLLTQILNKVESILSEQGLDLSSVADLTPTLTTVTSELDVVVQEVDSLTSNGATSGTIDEVKSLLSKILALLPSV